MNRPNDLTELYGPAEAWSGEADARLTKLDELNALTSKILLPAIVDAFNAPSILEYLQGDNKKYVAAWTEELADESEEFGGYVKGLDPGQGQPYVAYTYYDYIPIINNSAGIITNADTWAGL